MALTARAAIVALVGCLVVAVVGPWGFLVVEGALLVAIITDLALAGAVRTVVPLGIAARQGNHDVPWTVRVLPAFTSRRYLPEKLSRLRQLDGLVAANVRGQGTEFDSLRDYVDGDDVRSIDWRATARRDGIVIRTWRPERDRRVILVIDTGRTSAGRVGDAPRLDWSL